MPRMVTDDQKRKFGEALREARGTMSQAALGELVGVTGSAIGQWEGGAPPADPEAIFGVEVAVGCTPGRLSRHLGYVPVAALKSVDIVAALEADRRISDETRRVIVAAYRAAMASSAASAVKTGAAKARSSRR